MSLESIVDVTSIPGYYSRLVMAKNQGHFAIAKAFLSLMENYNVQDTESAEGRKALEKINQAKGHGPAIAAGVESSAQIPAGEASDWQSYVLENTPYTRKLALALADYLVKADLLETAYEMYLTAGELDEDGSSAEQLAAMAAAEDGTMANDFGKKCEEAKNHAKAAAWYKKAKDAGFVGADEALNRMQAFHGVTRFMVPWLEVAKKTGRRELADAILAIAENSNAGTMESVCIGESAVPPCTEEIDFWESELDAYHKFSGDSSEVFGNAFIAVGKILERAKMYNNALRWYKRAVEFNKSANADAHRMLPLKSKSARMGDAEFIYDADSPIPALWKI